MSSIRDRFSDDPSSHMPGAAPVSAEELIAKLERIQKVQTDLTALLAALNRVALIAETDPDGKFIFVNERFSLTSGFEVRDLIGRNFSMLKSGHQHESLFDDMWKTISGGKNWTGKIKNKRADSSYFWVESTLIPVLNSKNQIKKYVSISYDITQVIETGFHSPDLRLLPAFSSSDDNGLQQVIVLQNQLLSLQNELAALRKASESAIMVSETDKRGIITYVNDLFSQITGYSKHEIIGQNHRLIKSENVDSSVYDEMWRTISSGQIWKGLLENKTKTGAVYQSEVTITPISGPDGKPEKYIAISYDLTELISRLNEVTRTDLETNQQLETLRQEAEQLRIYNSELEELQSLLYSQVAALNNSALVAELNLEGHFLFVNDSYVTASGFSRDELMTGSRDLIPVHDNPHSEEIWTALTGGQTWSGLIKNQRKSGEWYYCHSTITPILDENRAVKKYVAIQYNLTESIERIKSLEIQVSELEDAEKLLRTENEVLTDKVAEFSSEKELSQPFFTAVHQSVMVAEVNLNGKITSANNYYQWMCETDPINVVGKDLFEGLEATRWDEVPESEKLLAMEESQKWAGILKYTAPSGKEYILKSFFIPVFNETSEITRFTGVFTDITSEMAVLFDREKESETLLIDVSSQAENLKVYKNAFTQIGFQLETDSEGIIIHANEPFLTLFGYSLTDLENRNAKEIIPDYQSDFSSDTVQSVKVLNAENEYVDLSLSVIDLTDSEGSIRLLFILNDFPPASNELTELRTLADKLKQENLQLRKVEQDFELKIHHLNNETENLRAQVKFAEQEAENLKTFVTHFQAELAEKQAQLEAVSDKETVTEEYKSKWLAEINARLSAEQKAEAINLQIEVKNRELSEAIEKINQLNAGFGEKENGLTELKNMVREAKLSEEALRLKWHQTIADVTLGKNQVEKLSELLAEERKEHERTKELLASFEAEINKLKTEPEKRAEIPAAQALIQEQKAGSTANLIEEQLNLPKGLVSGLVASFIPPNVAADIQVTVNEELTETQPEQVEINEYAFVSKRILLLQNDTDLLEKILIEKGHQVSAFQYGRELLQAYEDHKPDLILTEIKLQDISGFDLTDIIRNDYDDSSILIYALADESQLMYEKDFIMNGFAGILTVPFSIENWQKVLS